MTPHTRHAGLAPPPHQQPPWPRAEPPLVVPTVTNTSRSQPAHHAERRSARVPSRKDSGLGVIYPALLGCFVIFLVLALVSDRTVKAGAIVAGAAMIVSAAGRAVLPARLAGALVSRHRYLDAATLAAIGMGMVAFGLILPAP